MICHIDANVQRVKGRKRESKDARREKKTMEKYMIQIETERKI